MSIRDTPIPEPNDDQVLIKVVVSGTNPKDWKLPEIPQIGPQNSGDDIAGTVEKVGSNVTEFKVGDRVAAFHEMNKPGGSFAEYAIAWQHTTFHIPQKTTFEEGAAIPLAAMTSALGLYQSLGLPQPFGRPATEPIPLIVYGAASAVGAYAVQLAGQSNIHPLICVAGKSVAHVEKLIDTSKGDAVVDYRNGDEAVVEGIKKAANGAKLLYALDAVAEHGSFVNIGKVLGQGGHLTTVLPVDPKQLPDHVKSDFTMVGDVHGKSKDFGFVYFRYFAKGLQDGWFKPQPQVVVPGGLGGVQKGLQDLKDHKANAVKFVFRVEDTEGLKK